MRAFPLAFLLIGGLAACGLAACGGSDLGAAAPVVPAPTTPTPPSATGITAAVGCTLAYSGMNSSPKVNTTSTYTWSCSGTTRSLSGNGIPDHPVTGGNFATPVRGQVIASTFPLTPVNTGTAVGAAMQPVGYAINAVKLDPGTAGTCRADATSTLPGGGCVAAAGQDPWRIEAFGGAFTFGTDENNAHTQPDGAYHYHAMPEGLMIKANKGQGMILVGWAADGFPVYGRFGYTVAANAASGLTVMRASWQKKAVPDAGRPAVSIFPMGTFQQDYSYVAGSGDLDECNGRVGVTPEFPSGIYHYYLTETYPYIQRCLKGTRLGGGGPPPPP
jgi:hypothetical protein